MWLDRNVYQCSGDRIILRLELIKRCLRELCYTMNGELFVSMRSVDKTQSRVVRYKKTTAIMVIEKDNSDRPLFSVVKKTNASLDSEW